MCDYDCILIAVNQQFARDQSARPPCTARRDIRNAQTAALGRGDLDDKRGAAVPIRPSKLRTPSTRATSAFGRWPPERLTISMVFCRSSFSSAASARSEESCANGQASKLSPYDGL
jgi:hypothetical protein